MNYRTKYGSYGKSDEFISNAGDPIKIEYTSRYDDNGNIVVEESGKTDMQAYIDSFADECDLNKMIARFEMGDPDALNKVKGTFMDVSSFPNTYAELFNKVKEAEENFYSLPIDVKDLYENNPVKFYMEFGTEEFNKKIGELTKKYNVDGKEKTDVDSGTNE